MAKTYTTPAVVRQTTEFTVDDDTFTFAIPKTAGMLLDLTQSDDSIDRFSAMVNWLTDGLSDDDAAKMAARLRDPDDGLDTAMLATIIKDLMSEATDRPTG